MLTEHHPSVARSLAKEGIDGRRITGGIRAYRNERKPSLLHGFATQFLFFKGRENVLLQAVNRRRALKEVDVLLVERRVVFRDQFFPAAVGPNRVD